MGNQLQDYLLQREFFQCLEGDQKKRFNELLRLDFTAAKAVARYYCLKDQKRISQRVLAKRFGLKDSHSISQWINAVIFYLNPSHQTGTAAQRMAHLMKERVEKARKVAARTKVHRAIAKNLGLKDLPNGFPLPNLHILELIVCASQNGSLEQLKVHNPQWYRVLMLRYDHKNGIYRSHQAVSNLLGTVGRERVCRIEKDALRFLGIHNNTNMSKTKP